MSIESAYQLLYSGVLVVLGILIFFLLIRAVIGPRVTDRMICINMIGTMVIAAILILSVYLDEGYLADVGLIYVMISFISVIMLAAVYIPRRPDRLRYNPGAMEEFLAEQKAASGQGGETPVKKGQYRSKRRKAKVSGAGKGGRS